MISTSAIGIILAIYTTDNLIERLMGRTIGLQLLPEAKIIEEKSSGQMIPFEDNYFCLSFGLGVVFIIAMVIIYLDF